MVTPIPKSEENKAVLLQANSCVAQGDNEGFLSFCTGNLSYDLVGEKTLHGKEAVRAYMKAQYVEPSMFTVDKLIAEGNYVTANGSISLKDETGKMIDYAYCDVWRFRQGKMAQLKAFVINIFTKQE